MTTADPFKCGSCGFELATADNYKQHLLVAHRETPLAQQVIRELARREKMTLAASKQKRS